MRLGRVGNKKTLETAFFRVFEGFLGLGRAGIETVAKTAEKLGDRRKNAAKSAAAVPDKPTDPHELAALWGKLPVNMREALMAIAAASERGD